MGRRKSAEPLIKRKITLHKSTDDALSLYLHDPVHNREKYGELSSLIEALLRKHLKEIANVNLDDFLEESK